MLHVPDDLEVSVRRRRELDIYRRISEVFKSLRLLRGSHPGVRAGFLYWWAWRARYLHKHQ